MAGERHLLTSLQNEGTTIDGGGGGGARISENVTIEM